MTQSSMFLSILGFFLVMIVCLVMGKGTYRPSSLVEYQPRSGWAPGPAWLLGIGNGEYAFVAAGACVHISEEIPKPSRRIPLVMSVLPILPPLYIYTFLTIALQQQSNNSHRCAHPHALDHCNDMRYTRHRQCAEFFPPQSGALLSSHEQQGRCCCSSGVSYYFVLQ